MADTFIVKDGEFQLNGRPIKIYSGAIHYFRTLPEYWEDRLLKLKLAGFNTVETYVCWNLHERKKNVFDFSGMLDIVRFIKTAQKVGLYVIVRPGPYICAEWDFGGLPSWLLADKNIELRVNNPVFLSHIKDFFTELFSLLKPLLLTNGGNIIAMQIENEYGSFSNDKKYLNALKDIYDECGIDVLKFTSDGASSNTLSGGSIDGILPTLNFGSNVKNNMKILDNYGNIPKMCMEFWCGWFDHFSEQHHKRESDDVINEIRDFLDMGASFNIYMFHGGTNFGFTAGANHSKSYEPTVTSYDYCAFLTEWGDYTPVYHKIRKLLCEYQNIPLSPLPPAPKMQDIGEVALTQSADLFENLEFISQKHYSPTTRGMESFGQDFGLIYYKTKLKGTYEERDLILTDVHDFAQVYFDNEKVGVVDRLKETAEIKMAHYSKAIPVGAVDGEVDVGVLVEGMGRVNYGEQLCDSKGVSRIAFGQQALSDFEVYTIPLDNLKNLKFKEVSRKSGPVFLKGTFKASKGECFVNMQGFTKGYVFVNGFDLGRYWEIGPQKSLYLPGSLLKEDNEIIVFELEKFENAKIKIESVPGLE